MKAGKDGPMKKNFPGAFKNTTVEVGDNTITASKGGLTVTGPGGKISKYKPNSAGYNAAKQQYIDAGGESPMNLGSSTGLSGAQSRPKMVKPGGVNIDGDYVTEGGRRTYTPASVGTVLGGTPNQMKSPKKAKAKKAATGEGIAVYNNQGQLHAKYNPGDTGYDQALMMLQNQSPNQMKSPKKMAKQSPTKLKAKTGAKKDAMTDRKSAMTMKKSANKMNPGFDKLPKDVQAKIMKKKK